jgi:hypothetical protein
MTKAILSQSTRQTRAGSSGMLMIKKEIYFQAG